MEFLRFGSSIPGSMWGCCAVDVVQNFKVDPDAKASIQIVDGDGGVPVTGKYGALFAGPTWRDIFNQRIRFGTFGSRDMPNHAFLAVLTDSQINGTYGKAWMEILKETGFEFVRTVQNSVYTGQSLAGKGDKEQKDRFNYVFGLFRNIGAGAAKDQFTPPKGWTDLPHVKPEGWEFYYADYSGEAAPMADVTRDQAVVDRAIWDKLGPATLMSEKEVVAAGAPVWLAGQRSDNPQRIKPAGEAAKTAQGSFPVAGASEVLTA